MFAQAARARAARGAGCGCGRAGRRGVRLPERKTRRELVERQLAVGLDRLCGRARPISPRRRRAGPSGRAGRRRACASIAPASAPPTTRPVLKRLAHVAVAVQVLARSRLSRTWRVVQRERAGLPPGRRRPRARGGSSRPPACRERMRVVHALQPRHVDEARRVAGQHRAGQGERSPGIDQKPPSGIAFAPQRDALAALQHAPDERVRLELLQQVVHRERGVGVVEARRRSRGRACRGPIG